MDPKTIRTIAGLVLTPLALEMIHHGQDEECAIAADATVRACESADYLSYVGIEVHLPHQDYERETVSPILDTLGSSSSSGDPMTWQNSSMFDAADVAIRRRYAMQDAQTRIAAMPWTNRNGAIMSASTEVEPIAGSSKSSIGWSSETE